MAKSFILDKFAMVSWNRWKVYPTPLKVSLVPDQFSHAMKSLTRGRSFSTNVCFTWGLVTTIIFILLPNGRFSPGCIFLVVLSRYHPEPCAGIVRYSVPTREYHSLVDGNMVLLQWPLLVLIMWAQSISILTAHWWPIVRKERMEIFTRRRSVETPTWKEAMKLAGLLWAQP